MKPYMKPFILFQIRPEDAASDNEYAALLKFGGLAEHELVRIRLDQADLPAIITDSYSGYFIGGGPWNVGDPEEKKSERQRRSEAQLFSFLQVLMKENLPCFGICYGLGALLIAGGGIISRKFGEQAGVVTIEVGNIQDPLLEAVPQQFLTYTGHKEAVETLPHGAIVLAGSTTCPYQIVKFCKNVYGVQFHPEMDTEGLCIRADIYKDCGYFDPDQVEKIKADARTTTIEHPQKLLAAFVTRYKN